MTDKSLKGISLLSKLSGSLFFAGIIILVIGLYYWMIKAGIPYQDPTLEMQIRYTINLRIGDILSAMGIRTSFGSGIVWIVLQVLQKIFHPNNKKR